jgi:hypothetical protein
VAAGCANVTTNPNGTWNYGASPLPFDPYGGAVTETSGNGSYVDTGYSAA